MISILRGSQVKAQNKVLSLEEGKLAISEEKELPEVTCGSALLLQEALKRRGIALQCAGVASFLAHEKYILNLKLFAHMGREPPPGYSRTSVHQLLTADRLVWTKLIEDEVNPKRDASGRYPIDDALVPALQSYDVTVVLLPRESSSPLPRHILLKGKLRRLRVRRVMLARVPVKVKASVQAGSPACPKPSEN